jgi:hypothetical protein
MAADLANHRQLFDTTFPGPPRERGFKGEQYARKVQETTNGRRSSLSRKKGRTIKIFAEGRIKEHVWVDEWEWAEENGIDQAQG